MPNAKRLAYALDLIVIDYNLNRLRNSMIAPDKSAAEISSVTIKTSESMTMLNTAQIVL